MASTNPIPTSNCLTTRMPGMRTSEGRISGSIPHQLSGDSWLAQGRGGGSGPRSRTAGRVEDLQSGGRPAQAPHSLDQGGNGGGSTNAKHIGGGPPTVRPLDTGLPRQLLDGVPAPLPHSPTGSRTGDNECKTVVATLNGTRTDRTAAVLTPGGFWAIASVQLSFDPP